MYEIGRVYVWQNLLEHTHLNGQETTVTGPAEEFQASFYKLPGTFLYQETDTVLSDGRVLWTTWDQLRPKNDPAGEQKIRLMFEPKSVMEVA